MRLEDGARQTHNPTIRKVDKRLVIRQHQKSDPEVAARQLAIFPVDNLHASVGMVFMFWNKSCSNLGCETLEGP